MSPLLSFVKFVSIDGSGFPKSIIIESNHLYWLICLISIPTAFSLLGTHLHPQHFIGCNPHFVFLESLCDFL